MEQGCGDIPLKRVSQEEEQPHDQTLISLSRTPPRTDETFE